MRFLQQLRGELSPNAKHGAFGARGSEVDSPTRLQQNLGNGFVCTIRTGNQSHGFSQVNPPFYWARPHVRANSTPIFWKCDDEKRKRAHLALQTDGLQLLAFDQLRAPCKTNRALCKNGEERRGDECVVQKSRWRNSFLQVDGSLRSLVKTDLYLLFQNSTVRARSKKCPLAVRREKLARAGPRKPNTRDRPPSTRSPLL